MALFLPWNECQNVRRTSEPPLANAKRRRRRRRYKRKTLELCPSCARLRLVGEMSEQSAASRNLESGRKNRASTADDARGERRKETKHKTPVGRRQRCRLHDALSRKTSRHRTTCTVFPSRTILVSTIQKTHIIFVGE
jgi:hypothetical protein